MSRRCRLALLAFALVTALSMNATAARWMVAAAAHAPGAANTNWRTDLRLVNPSTTEATATVYLLPQGSNNAALPTRVTVTVPSAGQLALTDVLDTKFSFSGNAALLVESTEASLVVTSRTYNLSANGSTYGQFIPGVDVNDALAAREKGQLIYISKSNDYRTNVGFAGTTAAAGAVALTLLDSNNVLLGSKAFDIAPYGQIQINDVFGAVLAGAAQVARAEVTSTVPVVAYSSVIDNRTGDPIAMIAQHATDAKTDLTIAAVGHAAGAGNSAWRSDVRIFTLDGSGGDDQGPANGTITLSFYPANVSNPTIVPKTVTIAANQIVALEDIVLKTFGLGNATGALRVQSSLKLFATSRTYNQSTDGTFGQDIPAVSLDRQLTAGSVAKFSGLSNSGYRTNAGFFNGGSTAAELQLDLRDATGARIAQKAFHLDGKTMTQINDLFGYLGAGSAGSGSLWVTTTGGSLVAYASVIDNTSGDSVYVPASIAAGTVPPPPSAGDPGGNPSGQCVNIPFIHAGTRATYRNTDSSGVWTMITTFSSDSANQRIQNDQAFTSGGNSIIDSTFTLVAQNGLRLLTHAFSTATTSAAGFPIVVTTDSTFNPDMVLGPLSQYCAGATFSIPATVHTVVVGGTVPGPTQTINRPAATGSVIAINQVVSVAGGTFNTVEYHG
ncbi:MAG TPA: hypothetical protein VF713_01235, partial [Thermoanaerobaculia bacterium]